MAYTMRCPNGLNPIDRFSERRSSARRSIDSALQTIPSTAQRLAMVVAITAIICGFAWQYSSLIAGEQQEPATEPAQSSPKPSGASKAGTSKAGTSKAGANETDANEAGERKSGPDKTSKAKPRKTPRYERRGVHDPNGIGKFYMGREIAHVMGAAAISWLERPEREQEENIAELINALDLKPGQVVADIGAGSGRITLLMAEKVGNEGKVLAVDVQRAMLEALEFKLKKNKVDNVELILGKTADPRLPAESCDLAIMVDVYHEFEFPYEMIQKIAKGMRTGGRIVFVEFRMEDPEVPIKLVHKMSVEQVRKEMDQPGIPLKFKEVLDNLPWQHIIVFEKVDAADAAGSDISNDNSNNADESEKKSSEAKPEPHAESTEADGETSQPDQADGQPDNPNIR